MAILITGGAGYIGSHTCIVFLEAGLDIVVVDNYCNSSEESLQRVKSITDKDFPIYQADVNDKSALREIFASHSIDAVIHFAGLKAVGESNQIPLTYYHNNVTGTISLCQVMREFNCSNLVFSSSATVYGEPEFVPLVETCRTSATNPYGRSKLIVEEILQDLYKSESNFWGITLLRYFNPIGAHASGQIGEDPNDIPNNLLPYVSQVASGKLKQVNVFGDDYDTKDGTGVRDYIHVMDLARGHLAAYKHLCQAEPAVNIYNLGTGNGYSVLEIIEKFKSVSGKEIPFSIAPRRPGDIATCFANAQKAKDELGWECEFELDQMIKDAWNWQSQNPNGYKAQ